MIFLILPTFHLIAIAEAEEGMAKVRVEVMED